MLVAGDQGSTPFDRDVEMTVEFSARIKQLGVEPGELVRVGRSLYRLEILKEGNVFLSYVPVVGRTLTVTDGE